MGESSRRVEGERVKLEHRVKTAFGSGKRVGSADCHVGEWGEVR